MGRYIKDWQPRVKAPVPDMNKKVSGAPKKKKPWPLPVFAPMPGSGEIGDQAAAGHGISKREFARRKRKGILF